MAISGNRRCRRTSSIMQLPDDSLYCIFQRLDCKSDRDSFGLTCHHWLQIQNSSRKSLHCSFSSTIKPPLDRLLDRFPRLQSLSLFGYNGVPNSVLSQLQYRGSKLHFLRLDYCSAISDYGFSLVAAGCPCLTVISLYQCKIRDSGLQILSNSCSALKDVNLMDCSHITDHGIRALSQNCSQLRSVSIEECARVTGVGFKGCSQTLTWFQASSSTLEPEGIKGIVSGGGLEYLSVSGPSYWCVNYRGDHGLSAIGLSGFATRLKFLNFQMCTSVNDESVVAIAKGCPMLQDWSLASCHDVKLRGWESIGSNCYNLKRLHVNGCRNLCDLGLKALRDGCKRLSVLHINGCARISSAAMEGFKLLRRDVEIKENEVMFIGPNWPFGRQR